MMNMVEWVLEGRGAKEMNAEDAKVDALYEIAREIKKARQDIVERLGSIMSHLDDIRAELGAINQSLEAPK